MSRNRIAGIMLIIAFIFACGSSIIVVAQWVEIGDAALPIVAAVIVFFLIVLRKR